MGVTIDSIQWRWQKVLAANSTAVAFSAYTNTLTKPEASATVAIIQVPPSANSAMFKVFGTDANNETGSMTVYGLSRVIIGGGVEEWDGTLITELAATLSSTPTGASGGLGATSLFADTLVLTKGGMGVDITSPGDDRPAEATIDVKAFELLRVDFKVTTAAAINGLWRFLS